MIIRAQGHEFKRVYLAFHFVRNTAYSFWETIGIIVIAPDCQCARYDKGYEHFEKRFQETWEGIQSDYIRSSYEAIDKYRLTEQNILSVISPPINYWVNKTRETAQIMYHMYMNYVSGVFPDVFALLRMTAMLKAREAWFAFFLNTMFPNKEVVIQELAEKGHLPWLKHK